MAKKFVKKLPQRRRRPVIKRNMKATRSHATRVLAQGAGAITKKAFGAGKKTTTWRMALRRGLNARLPYHLGLPRPVGPYQVIRTTKLHSTSARVVVFCPLMQKWNGQDDAPRWFEACGIEDVDATKPINDATGNAHMIGMPLTGIGSAAEVVPAAMTVQVMCSDPLQTAQGIFTMGRVSQQLPLGGETRSWDTFKTQFDAYFKPRLLTGGKLALRGVTCNAIPLNMNEFSEFASPQAAENNFIWNDTVVPAALSPIVFTKDPGEVGSSITFLVTIEWRVRFDPFHPAAASHTFHPSTPDSLWNRVIGAASSMGHGVEDIADEVAELGADAAAAAVVGALAF
ncbi:putative capsid protein [Beihai weivirus-like virus 2]|uniref:putative capsid protein n=1 Tax=Beihai weivirus-like virus 2 TaxID=1922748 RepID=UPI00090BA97F|nr:putative capsid protein [Beihai weivirus-like virus 2]APG78092.1 putative capsid protein [Beihai weivirus-like virus 2]